MLRGRCGCNAVAYEVSDEFVAAFNCHCSNCRATTDSAFLPWGEIEREKLRVTTGADRLRVLGDAETNHEVRCGACWSLLDWTARDGAYVRLPYGTLVDEPGVTARFRRPTCSPIRAAPRPTSSAAPIGAVSPRSKESASPAMFRG